MHKFISILGMVMFILGSIVAALVVLLMIMSDVGSRPEPSPGFVLAVSISTAITGALLYCFGTIVDHLQAIRAAAETKART